MFFTQSFNQIVQVFKGLFYSPIFHKAKICIGALSLLPALFGEVTVSGRARSFQPV